MAKVPKPTFSLPRPQEHDDAFERWLHEETVPAYEATKADPSIRIPAKAVFAEVRALQQAT